MLSLLSKLATTSLFLGALVSAAPWNPPEQQCPGGPLPLPGPQSGINVYWHDYTDASQGTTACNVATGPELWGQDVAALDQKYDFSQTCGKYVKVTYNGISTVSKIIDTSNFDRNYYEGGCNGVVVNKSTFEKFGVSADQGILYGATWEIVDDAY